MKERVKAHRVRISLLIIRSKVAVHKRVVQRVTDQPHVFRLVLDCPDCDLRHPAGAIPTSENLAKIKSFTSKQRGELNRFGTDMPSPLRIHKAPRGECHVKVKTRTKGRMLLVTNGPCGLALGEDYNVVGMSVAVPLALEAHSIHIGAP